MKSIKLFYTLLIVALIGLSSCSKDENNPVNSNNNGGGNSLSNPSGQPIPGLAGNADGVLVTIGYEIQTAPGFPGVSISMGFASFGTGVDAGDVSVNGNTLGKTTESGSTFYLTPSPTNPTQTISGVNFDGSNHNWTVAGGNGIPQFSGSVQSPASFGLTAPANNATVSKASGINVTWNNTSSGAKVLVMLVSTTNSSQVYVVEDIADNGSHTIPASSLTNVSGSALLQVVKYRYNSATAGGKSYYMISEVVNNALITIN